MAYIGFQPYDGQFQIISLPDSAGATFAAGDVLANASGYLTIGSANTGAFVALRAYSGVTGTSIPVIPITPSQRWLCQSSAATTVAGVGTNYGITYTSGSQCITFGTAGSKEFYPEQLDPRDGAQTSAGGRVIGRFNICSTPNTYDVA